MSRSNTTRYRAARAGELDQLVKIDDDACTLYADAGLDLSFGAESPVVREEQVAWTAALAKGDVRLAMSHDGLGSDGFIAMAWKDGRAYVEQLSVRRTAMRRGIGRALMAWGEEWARQRRAPGLLLTTYGHVPWNRRYYEALGWFVLPETAWGPEIRATVAFQRAHLPDPQERVAMVKKLV